MRNICFVAVSLFIACQSVDKNHQETIYPNIIFILADDLGFGDLGCYNAQSKIPTPHLDRLALQGMRFTDAHAPGSVCTPTRYAILTGRYCWRSRLPVGVLRGYGRSLIESERTTVAELLKQSGYSTGVVGKWHLGLDWIVKDEFKDSLGSIKVRTNEVGMVTEMDPTFIDFRKAPSDGPLDHGFDYSFILPASLDMDPYCFLENDILTDELIDTTEGNDLNTGYTGAFWRPGLQAKNFSMEGVMPMFTDKAIKFMENNAEKESPFFLYLPYASPHTPWVPTKEFEGETDAGSYGDFVHMVDAMVGQLMASLERSNISQNTLVIFTSDNGPFWTPSLIEQYDHRSAGLWRGMKADAWEGGHRIPFLARWPEKISSESTCDNPISLVDFMATCADIVKTPLEGDQGPDSHSILPLLLGDNAGWTGPEALIHHSSRNFFAVRQDEWKLILGLGSGGFSEPRVRTPEPSGPTGQLYNLGTDPGEEQNLFVEYPGKVAELTKILDDYRQKGHSRGVGN